MTTAASVQSMGNITETGVDGILEAFKCQWWKVLEALARHDVQERVVAVIYVLQRMRGREADPLELM